MAMTSAQWLFAVFIIFMCAAPQLQSRSCCIGALGCRRYLFLNSLLNLMNRWALGLHGLRFPLIMTASHMIFGSCALSPMMLLNQGYASKHASVLQNDWKGLVAIATMNGFQIACNNASLTVMELSMNQARGPAYCRSGGAAPADSAPAPAAQVIRASVPVCVAIFGVCIEHKVPSKAEVACLVVVSIGVMCACAPAPRPPLQRPARSRARRPAARPHARPRAPEGAREAHAAPCPGWPCGRSRGTPCWASSSPSCPPSCSLFRRGPLRPPAVMSKLAAAKRRPPSHETKTHSSHVR